jgi:hypothetical protein
MSCTSSWYLSPSSSLRSISRPFGGGAGLRFSCGPVNAFTVPFDGLSLMVCLARARFRKAQSPGCQSQPPRASWKREELPIMRLRRHDRIGNWAYVFCIDRGSRMTQPYCHYSKGLKLTTQCPHMTPVTNSQALDSRSTRMRISTPAHQTIATLATA